MIAFVGSVVWACLAGIAIAVVVAGVVAAIVRVQRPAAATRCLLWFVALAVCAAAPLAIVGTMVVRGWDHAAVSSPNALASVGDAPADGQDAANLSDGGAQSPRLVRSAPAALHAFAGAAQTLRRPPALTHTVALAIVAVWGIGALAGLIGLGRSLLRVHALKRRSSPLDGALADDLPWLTETAGREIYLRLSYEIETPIAVGFRRPVILLPTDMATIDGLRAIESLVMHEYAHLAHYDDWSNLVQRLIERVVWFNPLVWIVGRRIALEREVAADDAVVARTNDAKEYASTLWRMAREMRMPEHVVVAPGAMFTRKQISIRIERLLDETRARRPHAGLALVAVALGACTVAAVAATAPPIVLPTAAQPPAVAVEITTPAPDAAPVDTPAPTDVRAMPAPAATPHPRATRHPAVAVHPPAHTHEDAALSVLPALPTLPPLPPIPPIPTIATDAMKRAEAAMTRAVALAPHRLPDGDLTRGIVAACRTCDFSRRDLSGLDLSRLDFYGANFDGADLSGADLSGARLYGVSMRKTDLSGVNFTGARMTGSRFEGATFDGADFTNARFIGSSIDVSALHANGSLRTMVDSCDGCNFANTDLHGQDLHGLRLDGANFSNADLHGVNLRGSHLSGSNFQGANLDNSDLRDTNLTGANLSGASMDGALTTSAILTGATLP